MFCFERRIVLDVLVLADLVRQIAWGIDHQHQGILARLNHRRFFEVHILYRPQTLLELHGFHTLYLMECLWN